jgi:hypothetical protein
MTQRTRGRGVIVMMYSYMRERYTWHNNLLLRHGFTRSRCRRSQLSHPCCDTGPGLYSGPPDGLPAHLRHTPDPPRAITVQLRSSTHITPHIGAPDHHYGLPASTDMVRIRTTPYGTSPTYSGALRDILRASWHLRRTSGQPARLANYP